MFFNSYVFIFAFLPVVMLGFYFVGRFSHSLESLWLAAASLVFYGWWDVRYVGLGVASIAFNFGVCYLMGAERISLAGLVMRTFPTSTRLDRLLRQNLSGQGQ